MLVWQIFSYSPFLSADTLHSVTSVDEVVQYFVQQDKAVLTFVGYSGAEYEAKDKMLLEARNVLAQHSPQQTIVNIGATAPGIGAVYEIAKKWALQQLALSPLWQKSIRSHSHPLWIEYFILKITPGEG